MTISLFTVAEGAAYSPYVQRWWYSVELMDPKPDEVVVVIHKDDKAGVRKIISKDQAVIVELDEPWSNNYFTKACAATTSEWVAFSGIDDIMLPQAYKDVPAATKAGADIIVGTIILSSGQTWRGSWDPPAMQRFNTLPAHSPYRKSLWEKVGGFPDIHWSDWGFWMKCAQQNPVIFQGTEPLAIFDIGEGRSTMSGVGLPEQVRVAANQELQAFASTL